MFEGIKERWDNRGTKCLKCQKKLVGKEKWICKKCQTDMTEGAVMMLIIGALTGIVFNSHNEES